MKKSTPLIKGIRNLSGFIGAVALVSLLASCKPNSTALPESPPTPTTIVQPIEKEEPAVIATLPASPTQETPQATLQAAAPVTFPDPAAYHWAPVVGGLTRPSGLVAAGDGSGRLFLLEQAGRILVLKNGTLLPDPFLDIRGRVGSAGNEQGLLGLAFSPSFNVDGTFYLNYTDFGGDTVIARYHLLADSDRGDAESEEVLLHVKQPYANHNGGVLTFGPEGYLYIGLGDGGSGGDPQGNGQSLETLLGKLLRIDVNQEEGYRIPGDNPFVSGGGRPEIWAYGLRNPWQISFDRANGDQYIADVGQNQWEEIDFIPAGSPGGANLGWSYREGAHPYQGTPPEGLMLVEPIYEYDHSQGCSVTGGAVYRGRALPEWQGVYLFGDYCRGTVWGLLRDGQGNWQIQHIAETGALISSFGQDEAGEIYLLDHRSGQMFRFERK
ncbi:MAG: PQQ-dependent sugar dehydrogenase [Anaerolineaceae bacterium]|nr:PQQ-dependent sugar dehydrogenase [Anaerolineaceae bacterium]